MREPCRLLRVQQLSARLCFFVSRARVSEQKPPSLDYSELVKKVAVLWPGSPGAVPRGLFLWYDIILK